MITELRLAELAERWATARASELANAQSYLIELCEALGVERPSPAGGGYQFELAIRMVHADGTESTSFADFYKENHFVLEAKDEEPERSTDLLLRREIVALHLEALAIIGELTRDEAGRFHHVAPEPVAAGG